MTVQPPISTIPCKTLYLLANFMLFFSMFSSPAASPTIAPGGGLRLSHSNHCHPEHSEGSAFRRTPLCALSVSAFSSFRLFAPGIPLLSRKESASISFHGLYTSFVFILLRTLWHSEKRYPHSFQYLTHSLAKTPGGRGHSPWAFTGRHINTSVSYQST